MILLFSKISFNTRNMEFKGKREISRFEKYWIGKKVPQIRLGYHQVKF